MCMRCYRRKTVHPHKSKLNLSNYTKHKPNTLIPTIIKHNKCNQAIKLSE